MFNLLKIFKNNNRNSSESILEKQVREMNEYNGTNFEYVDDGRVYNDKWMVGGTILKRGLGVGWHGVFIDYAKKYKEKDNLNICLIAESKEACLDLAKLFPKDNIENIVDYSDKEHGEDYNIDLNIKQNFKSKYDMVLSQALLEHIVNPFMAIENFCDLLVKNGILILHTHNVKMEYHPYPIDCLRFYKDFFKNITKYLPYIYIYEYLEVNCHIFVVYKKIM